MFTELPMFEPLVVDWELPSLELDAQSQSLKPAPL
jgi:hypothetical protein